MSIRPIRSVLKSTARRAQPVQAGCAVVLPQTELRVPTSAFTLEGFRAWAKSDESPEHVGLTFVNQQVIIDMSGEEIQAHNLPKAAIHYVVYGMIVGEDRGLFFPDGVLITNVPAGVSNIPDGSFVSWESLEGGRVRLVPDKDDLNRYLEVEGIPDWVLEIISDSSVGKDIRLLREAYHRARIPEYWLVDARGKEIDFQILVHKPRGYVPAPHRGGWQTSPIFGRRFRLERRRARLGYWHDTLQVKP